MKNLFDRVLVPGSSSVVVSEDLLCTLNEGVNSQREPNRILAEPTISLSPFGILELNLSLPAFDGKPYASLELKVKSNISSTCPMVVHPYKLHHGKFSYMQEFKHTCKSKVPWGIFRSVSHYDPHKLCAGGQDFSDSFKELLENPQNNLKVALNGHHVYGWSKNNSSDRKSMEDGLSSIFSGVFDETMSIDILTHIVQLIVMNEEVLTKLEQYQCLDILDTEGCEIAYRRLESIYQDAIDKVLIDFFSLEALNEHDVQLYSRVSSFIHAYTFNRHIASLEELDLTDPIQLLASIRVHKDMSPQERQQQLEAFATTLLSLNAGQLMILLKMAMVAMICKDASVIVTFSVIFVRPGATFSNDGIFSKVTRQGDDTNALLQIFDKNTQEELLRVSYKVGLIDLQLKSLSKFTSNIEKEAKIFRTLSKVTAE
eukprot:gene27066-32704_t